jgi:hypothetical protein
MEQRRMWWSLQLLRHHHIITIMLHAHAHQGQREAARAVAGNNIEKIIKSC